MQSQSILFKSFNLPQSTNQNISQNSIATRPQQPDKVELSTKKKNIIKYSAIGVGVLGIIMAGIKLPKLFKKIIYEREKKTHPTKSNIKKPSNVGPKGEIKKCFSFSVDEYKTIDSKPVEDSFESFMQKRININGPDVQFNSGFQSLTKHKYNTIPECFTETATLKYDYTPLKVSNNQVELINKSPASIIPKEVKDKWGDDNVGKWIVGVTEDDKKYLFFSLNDGRKDAFGRTIRQITTLISPNSSFTEAQKDLISVLSSYSANDLNKMYDTPLSQCIIDSTNRNSGSILDGVGINLDTLLSGIMHWKSQIKQPATDIIEKIEKLKPSEYISN